MVTPAQAFLAQPSPAPGPGPTELADTLLAAAIDLDADRVWLDPQPGGPYAISISRRDITLATASVAPALGSALVARLAMLADVDLAATRAVSGTTRIRRGHHAFDLVLTLRPHPTPRREERVAARSSVPASGPSAELVLSSRSARRARGTAQPYRDLEPGDCVDHYRVAEHLGAGGMGQVYRVEHLTLGRQYALKVLHREVIERDPRSVERFVREARAASRIRHPHIVDVFDFGYLDDGRPYLVMELLTGTSLADVIDRHGAMAPRYAFTLVRQLIEALTAAHDAGVIHADVTPSNILITGDRIKLFDFGLAELRETTRVPANAGFVMGTPSYVSPEQLRGGRASVASDQYAVGIVLYEMLAGYPPFHADTLSALCRQHICAPVPTLGALPVADALIARCLAKSPEDRFADLDELRAALDVLDAQVGDA
jgi:hypothetical protein